MAKRPPRCLYAHSPPPPSAPQGTEHRAQKTARGGRHRTARVPGLLCAAALGLCPHLEGVCDAATWLTKGSQEAQMARRMAWESIVNPSASRAYGSSPSSKHCRAQREEAQRSAAHGCFKGFSLTPSSSGAGGIGLFPPSVPRAQHVVCPKWVLSEASRMDGRGSGWPGRRHGTRAHVSPSFVV